MIKRIFLLVATNFAILMMITIIAKITGLDRLMHQSGLISLLIMSALFGFVGSIVSLFLSKSIAIRTAGVRLIKEPGNEVERWLVSTVKHQADMLGLGMPDVGIFPAAEPNAFATGAKRNAALVAVSAGLLNTMNRDEVEAVLGHEMSHVANGDMITMTLLQGIMNTFVLFFSRLLANLISSVISRDSRGGSSLEFIFVMVLQTVLGLLASLVVCWFSRHREYRADSGSAGLTSSSKMISALEALQRQHSERSLPESIAAFGIDGSFHKLLSTHPPLEKRIEALREYN